MTLNRGKGSSMEGRGEMHLPLVKEEIAEEMVKSELEEDDFNKSALACMTLFHVANRLNLEYRTIWHFYLPCIQLSLFPDNITLLPYSVPVTWVRLTLLSTSRNEYMTQRSFIKAFNSPRQCDTGLGVGI